MALEAAETQVQEEPVPTAGPQGTNPKLVTIPEGIENHRDFHKSSTTQNVI